VALTETGDYALVVVKGQFEGASGKTVSAVSVDGNAATHLKSQGSGGSDGPYVSIWLVELALGATADVVVTIDGGNFYFAHVDIYAVTGIDPTAADDAADLFVDGGEHTAALSLDVPEGGVAVGACVCFQLTSADGDVAWSGMTKRADHHVFGTTRCTSADYEAATAQAPLTVEVATNTNAANANQMAACSVSFGPA
jgi:hypothetical protein